MEQTNNCLENKTLVENSQLLCVRAEKQTSDVQWYAAGLVGKKRNALLLRRVVGVWVLCCVEGRRIRRAATIVVCRRGEIKRYHSLLACESSFVLRVHSVHIALILLSVGAQHPAYLLMTLSIRCALF